MDAVGLPLGRAERQDRVPGQDQRDHDRGVPEPAVDVVEDQRQPGLTGVGLVRLGDGARRRAQPERAVVGLAVVVAGHPEAQREDQDDQRRRQRQPAERLAEVRGAVDAVAEARRVERREVRLGEVVRAHERPPGRVDDERREHHEGGQRVEPPPVGPQGLLGDPGPGGPGHACGHPVVLSVQFRPAEVMPRTGASPDWVARVPASCGLCHVLKSLAGILTAARGCRLGETGDRHGGRRPAGLRCPGARPARPLRPRVPHRPRVLRRGGPDGARGADARATSRSRCSRSTSGCRR